MLKESTNITGAIIINQTVDDKIVQKNIGNMRFTLSDNNFDINVYFEDKDTALQNIDAVKAQFQEFYSAVQTKVNAVYPVFNKEA